MLEDGAADPFYQRFTTSSQEALVLGNSKAAQGIVPTVLNENLQELYEGKLYNYSFTVYNSPFGAAYLKSVQAKLSDFDGTRCFIITVDPWSVSSDVNDPNNPEKFREVGQFIDDIEAVNSNPNIPFLLHWFSKSFYEILLARTKQNLSKIHEDGWFETTGDLVGTTETQRRAMMVEFYSNYLSKYSFSELRFRFLESTIEYLKVRGDVVLVRMPLHADILNIENRVDPQFDTRMKTLSETHVIPYFDFSKNDDMLSFKDGLHLTRESAFAFSEKLAHSIKQYNNQIE